MADAYADLVFEPEPFTTRSVVERFLDQSPEVVDAMRALRASFVMMPERRDLPRTTRIDERAQIELAHAEELARDLAPWPVYVGSGRLFEVIRALKSSEGGLPSSGPPLVAAPARGALAGYVLMGEGGVIFYAVDGRLGHADMAEGLMLWLLGRRLAPGPSRQ